MRFSNIVIQECNPNMDIVTIVSTLFSILATIHNTNGYFLANPTIPRLDWLWERYCSPQPPNLPNYHPAKQDFATEIMWLLQWWLLRIPPKTPSLNRLLPFKIAQYILQHLVYKYKLEHSYYFNPLTCPLDMITNFGSIPVLGSFQIFWYPPGLGIPTNIISHN